ncbi:hypothetical protein X770_32385 [Mesorhizobium sp. LSJC269B00]|uniref:glucosaminidase domain-containing protein n=1 Tax=Mesorhizobium sp. LSJC269B00 TaxID=1287326 RepID=UPI0003CF3F1B|nr:glucosaminidase domain-containing protein [Mesorhizobium sp. LSJC269B00]ESW78390.1 hypothetical protein X770_32385 [Mesorhizobium sp. LSJC269B00]
MFSDDGASVEIVKDNGAYAIRVTYPEVSTGSSEDDPATDTQAAPIPPDTNPVPQKSIGAKWNDLVAEYNAYDAVPVELKVASLSQWILESNRGNSDLAMKALNFGGIKYRARMEGYASAVDYTGSDNEDAVYCLFSSVHAFIAGYWHFIESGPYDGWKQFNDDGAGYIRHIAPNYAADANYVIKVLSLFDEARSFLGGSQAPATPVPPKPVATPPDDIAPGTKNIRVAVVVGHNSVSTGSSAVSPISRSEFAFNGVVADQIVAESPHYNVIAEKFLRVSQGSYSSEIAQVYGEVQAWGADCAIELHFNSASPEATGSMVLFRAGNGVAQGLARPLALQIQSLLGLPLRNGNGLQPLQPGDRGYGSVSALATVPSVLIEPFFGSNKGDCLKVASIGEAGLARAYLRGVRDWASASEAVS